MRVVFAVCAVFGIVSANIDYDSMTCQEATERFVTEVMKLNLAESTGDKKFIEEQRIRTRNAGNFAVIRCKKPKEEGGNER